MNGENSAVANQVRGPAIGLVVTGILGGLGAIGNAIFSMINSAAQQAQYRNAGVPESMMWMFGSGMIIVLTAIGVAFSILVLFAGMKMMKLQSYGLSMAGSIVAMVPCLSPCCCIGLPIGIWALIVLMKPEVKQAFH